MTNSKIQSSIGWGDEDYCTVKKNITKAMLKKNFCHDDTQYCGAFSPFPEISINDEFLIS